MALFIYIYIYININIWYVLLPIQCNPNSRFSLIFFFLTVLPIFHTPFSSRRFSSYVYLPPFTTPVVHSQPCKRVSFYIICTAIYNGERVGEHTRGEEKEYRTAICSCRWIGLRRGLAIARVLFNSLERRESENANNTVKNADLTRWRCIEWKLAHRYTEPPGTSFIYLIYK